MSNRSNLPYDGYGPSKQSDNTAYSISHDYEPLANRHQSRQSAYSMQQSFQEHNVGYGAFQPNPGQVEQSQARNSGYGPAMQEDYLGENACAPEVPESYEGFSGNFTGFPSYNEATSMMPYPPNESQYMQSVYSQQYLSAGGTESPYGPQSLGGFYAGIDSSIRDNYNQATSMAPYPSTEPTYMQSAYSQRCLTTGTTMPTYNTQSNSEGLQSLDTYPPTFGGYIPSPASYGGASSNHVALLNAESAFNWQQSQDTLQGPSEIPQSLLATLRPPRPRSLVQNEHSGNLPPLKDAPIQYTEHNAWLEFRRQNRSANIQASDGYVCVACTQRFGAFKGLVTHEETHWAGGNKPRQPRIANGYVCLKCSNAYYNPNTLADHESRCYAAECPKDWEGFLKEHPNISRYVESKKALVCPVDTCEYSMSGKPFGEYAFLRHIVRFHIDILATLGK